MCPVGIKGGGYWPVVLCCAYMGSVGEGGVGCGGAGPEGEGGDRGLLVRPPRT